MGGVKPRGSELSRRPVASGPAIVPAAGLLVGTALAMATLLETVLGPAAAATTSLSSIVNLPTTDESALLLEALFAAAPTPSAVNLAAGATS